MNRRPTATRRTFMKGAAAVAGAGFFVSNQRAYAQSKSPNEQINIAWIGIGGKGSSDVDHAGQVGKVVAICDVDEKRLSDKAEKFADAETFVDYREMIEKLGDRVDAIGVSTPDHSHYPAAMMAMKKGKHVYCQKPLTYSVWEARQLREAAAKFKVKTQMGNQGSASDGMRKGVEWIRAGVIGPVKEIHVWTNRPVWPQAPKVVARPPAMEPPKHLHWDLWLGPAPERPYGEYEEANHGSKGAYHSFNWRGWWDFGTGALGDMACHTANLAFMGANLKYPTTVKGEAGDLNDETYPAWARVAWDFPAGQGRGPVRFHWYEGRLLGDLIQPDKALFTGIQFGKGGEKLPASGALIVGEKGALFQNEDYGAEWKLLPAEDFKDVKAPEVSVPRNPDATRDKKGTDLAMKTEWARAIKGEIDQAFSNFGHAGVFTEAVLLGNVAIRNRGQELKWDGEAMRFTNNDKANQSLRRQPRSGWDVTM